MATYYRPRSRGDNTFGSVRVCVCLSVCLWALSCLNRLTFDFHFWHESRPALNLSCVFLLFFTFFDLLVVDPVASRNHCWTYTILHVLSLHGHSVRTK